MKPEQTAGPFNERMQQPPSCGGKLTQSALCAQFSGAPVTPDIRVYDTVDSTNSQAKRLLASGARPPLLVVSNEQSAGRGRLGRSFYSPASTGVYMTLALDAAACPADTLRITSYAAVAVVRAIEALTDRRPMIKWVNDIVLDGRKICGILSEAVTNAAAGSITHVIVGVGVNVATVDFPDALDGVAASLLAPGLTREALIFAIATQLLDPGLRGAQADWMDFYRAHSLVIGKHIRYCGPAGEAVAAKALAIDDAGGLVIEHADGSRAVLSTGEITLRLA